MQRVSAKTEKFQEPGDKDHSSQTEGACEEACSIIEKPHSSTTFDFATLKKNFQEFLQQ